MSIINGTPGNDLLIGTAGDDTIHGGAGHDWLTGGLGNDVLYGDEGIDYAAYINAPSAVNANLTIGTSTGGDGNDTFFDIEGLVGSAFNDTLDGNADNNDLMGGAGNDLLRGFGGTDYFEGNGGTDTLLGGDGDDFFIGGSADLIDGGSGNDAVYYNWNRSDVTIVADGTNLLLSSALFAGQDTIVGGIELLQFTSGDRMVAITTEQKLTLQLVTALFGGAAAGNPTTLAHYWGLLQTGLTLQEVVTAAIASPEFAAAAGSHSNADAVAQVFHNVQLAVPAIATPAFQQSLNTAAATSQGAMGALAVQALASIATDMPVTTAASASPSIGSSGGDTLAGTSGADLLFGRGGNDVFDAKAGSDVIDGGAGLDVAVYATTRSSYTITHSDLGLTVKESASADSDTLISVERVAFSNTKLAFDLDGHAGTTAKIIAALFGPGLIAAKGVVGLGLEALDGGMSEHDLVAAAIATSYFVAQAGGSDNAHFVDHVYFNLTGVHPSASVAAPYVHYLDAGIFTQAQLGVLATESDANLAHIDFTGLAQTGLEYT